MKLEKVNIGTFSSKLGRVDLILTSSTVQNIKKLEDQTLIETDGHLIEIIVFNDIKKWFQDTKFPVEKTIGWIIRVLRKNDFKDEILIQCLLTPKNKKVTANINSGEYLDSLWIEDDKNVVSLGTEDGEMMKQRSEKNDWMPFKFMQKLGFNFSFTNYLDFGFKTKLPELEKGEKIYFHYLVATDKKKKSKDHPSEDDISTSLAVDFPKRTLIQRLKIREEITC